MDRSERQPNDETARPRTTLRRHKVIQLWNQGRTHDQIAQTLGVSSTTVARHLSAARGEGESAPRRMRYWTADEDQTLRDLLSLGNLQTAEIAARMGRSSSAVLARAKRLRREDASLPRPAPRPGSWSQQQDECLVKGYRAGWSREAIARSVDRAPSAVDARLKVLRGRGVELPFTKPRWTQDEQRRLAERYREGLGYKRLAVEFGLSRTSIRVQVARLRALGFDLER